MASRKNSYQAVIDSPVGKLGIRMSGKHLIGIDFLATRAVMYSAQTSSCQHVVEQLGAYFDNPHSRFSIPILLQDSHFRHRVWGALRAIPAGKTRCYGEIAALLDTSARAVGGACRANPVPIIIPCHRVVAKSGLGGFSGVTAGRYLVIKRWLLRHEGVEV
jgi:methylated-DNA-[protein]-cysteine S-methyltransferase